MDLELSKQLEDLKKQNMELSRQIDEQMALKIELHIPDIKKDFLDFFAAKGFSLDSSDFPLKASYGQASATLTRTHSNSFELNLKSLSDETYMIFLGGTYPPFYVKVSNMNEGSLESELHEKIRSLQNEIRQKQEHLNNFILKEWYFYIQHQYFKAYNSFHDVLTSLIN